jgi:hypothetical protein
MRLTKLYRRRKLAPHRLCVPAGMPWYLGSDIKAIAAELQGAKGGRS